MRKIILAGAAALALAVGGCSNSMLAAFENDIANFETGVAAVNQAVGQINADLLKNCNAVQTTLSAINALVGAVSTSTTAKQSVAVGNAVITTYCQTAPSDIPSALAATAAEITAAKAAYASVKAGN